MNATFEYQAEGSKWFYARTESPRGVILLVHGLNQRPSSWSEMIEHLNSINFHVYRLALQGHRGLGFGDMQTVSDDGWAEEMRAACEEITQCFPEAPRVLLGFSLGCLLALTVQLQDGSRHFDRQVLLAPALAVQPYTRLVLPLCGLVSFLPSRSPSNYVANSEGTTAQAYRALFQLEQDFRSFSELSLLNFPTLVLMRSDDELISYRLTIRLMKKKKLTRWQMVRLEDNASLYQRLLRFRHLIVDRQSAGEMIWNRMTSELTTFLSSQEISRAPD